MSNPESQAEPNASLPVKATLPTTPSGKSPRKGPRRATAPAGAPSKAASVTPPLLVVGADGMVIPTPSESGVSPSSTDDAGHSPSAAPLPRTEGEISDKSAVDSEDAPAESADETAALEETAAESTTVSSENEEPASENSGDDADKPATDQTADTEPANAASESTEESSTSDENEAAPSGDSNADASAEPAEAEVPEATEDAEAAAAETTDESADTGKAANNAVPSTEESAAEDEDAEKLSTVEAEAAEESSTSDENEAAPSGDSNADASAEAEVPEAKEAADATSADTTDKSADTDKAASDAEPSTEESAAEDEDAEKLSSSDEAAGDEAEDTKPAAVDGEPAAESSAADADDEAPSVDSNEDEEELSTSDDAAEAKPADVDGEAAQESPAATETEESPSVDSNSDAPAEPADAADPEATELAEKSDAASTGEPADSADEGDSEPAPMSRRERRMAEQKLGSGASPADALAVNRTADAVKETAATAPVSDATSTMSEVDPQRGPGEKKRKRPLSFLKGLLFMVIIAAVVVGTGTVLSGKDDATLKQSQTELNRQAAWESTSSLANQAATLATSATAPKVQEALNQITTDLAAQAEALGDGLPHEESASNTATSSAPATLSDFVVALNASGGELLSSALTAEQALGRVFAAAGTSQLLQAQNLSSAAGSTSPGSRFLPVRVDFAAPKGPECKSVLEPRSGVTIDSALRAAALGEQQAVYAYQVATTRLSEPQFSTSAALLARHQTKLKVLNEELKVRCLPQAEAAAGYTLDPQFTTSAAPALAALEADLTRLYADLTALSSAPVVDATDAPAPQVPVDGKSTANPTQLRQISVSWLLDSASTEVLWGGSISALSGLPAS